MSNLSPRKARSFVKVTEDGIQVECRIFVVTDKSRLTKYELDLLRDSLTDGVMLAVNRATYLQAPLSKIKIMH